MKKIKLAIISLCLLFGFSISAYSQPGLQFLMTKQALNLSFEYEGPDGVPLDWWLVIIANQQIYYLDTEYTWMMANSIDEIKPGAQINAVNFENLEIAPPNMLNTTDYDAFFGVDFKQDGNLDYDTLVYVKVEVRF
jgi:hypothetical protein